MPIQAILSLILPLLAGLAGSKGAGLGASGLGGLLAGQGGRLGGLGKSLQGGFGQTAANIGGFVGGSEIAGRLMHPRDNDESLSALQTQIQARRGTAQDPNLLLEQRHVADALSQMGVDPATLVL